MATIIDVVKLCETVKWTLKQVAIINAFILPALCKVRGSTRNLSSVLVTLVIVNIQLMGEIIKLSIKSCMYWMQKWWGLRRATNTLVFSAMLRRQLIYRSSNSPVDACNEAAALLHKQKRGLITRFKDELTPTAVVCLWVIYPPFIPSPNIPSLPVSLRRSSRGSRINRSSTCNCFGMVR